MHYFRHINFSSPIPDILQRHTTIKHELSVPYTTDIIIFSSYSIVNSAIILIIV